MYKRQVPLCGNSIGTDRRFLQEYMPTLEEFLHYRNVDVSTLKELTRRWHPEVLESLPEKETTHRALDDIRESIAELQHYRDTLFPKAPVNPPTLDEDVYKRQVPGAGRPAPRTPRGGRSTRAGSRCV